ncbi:hypothetical protein [Phenylobacterium sp.]|uniref:hypothetical protein n=1 Tax=Phenylobacterium sp. TaxID=1871053 RepID=UPI00301BEDA3
MDSPSSKFEYPDNLDMSGQLAYGVGVLVMQWGICESVFYGILDALAGQSNTGIGVVVWFSSRNNRDRIDLIVHLSKARALSTKTEREVAAACKRMRSVTKVRNFFCHAYYEADALGDGAIKTVRGYSLTDAYEPLAVDARPLTKGLLNEIASAIRETARLNYDAWKLLLQIQKELKVQHPELPPGLHEYLSKADRPSDP